MSDQKKTETGLEGSAAASSEPPGARNEPSLDEIMEADRRRREAEAMDRALFPGAYAESKPQIRIEDVGSLLPYWPPASLRPFLKPRIVGFDDLPDPGGFEPDLLVGPPRDGRMRGCAMCERKGRACALHHVTPIVSDPGTMGGAPVFDGTRVSVARVAGLAARGVPLVEIQEDYPTLSEADVKRAKFIHQNDDGDWVDEDGEKLS